MDRSPLYLALDQGGSASRAIVFDGGGRARAAARIEVADTRPGPGRVEQDPDTVVASLRQVAAEAMAQLEAAERPRVAAAGLSCQRSSLVCWDRERGGALSPVLSWQDTRAADWLAAQALDAEAIRAATGLYPNAHFGVSKMRWCLDHLDPVRRAADEGRLAIGPLAAFLAFRLLAQRPCLVDPANASRTLLFDLARGDWHRGLLDRFGIDRRWLPDLARSDAAYGDLALPAAQAPQPLPLRLLSGDQSTAAFAYGELRADAAYVNVGTGAFVYRLAPPVPAPDAAAPPPAASRLLRSVVHWSDAPQHVVEGTVNGAGSALAAFAQRHGIADVAPVLQAHWTGDAPGDVVFLNGVGGLGSPDWRAAFPSRFVGDASPERQLVAIGESIVFLVQRNLELLQSLGAPCTQVLASGGVSRADRFCQTLADVSGLPVRRPAQCEASARGTAFLLAGRPAQWPALPEERFEPASNPSLQARHRRWCDEMASALSARG